jgi:hypothetical protein
MLGSIGSCCAAWRPCWQVLLQYTNKQPTPATKQQPPNLSICQLTRLSAGRSFGAMLTQFSYEM